MPNFIWISLIGSTQFHMHIWISLIGHEQFHMKYLLGSARLHMNIGTSLFESTRFHMNISCLKVPNFIWNSLFGSTQLQMNIWIPLFRVCLIGNANFHMNFVVWKYLISFNFVSTFEFPWWETPNLTWISTFGSAKFHLNFLDWIAKFHFKRPNFIWNSLFGSAKFHMNVPVWRSKFIRTCQIPCWKYSILCEFPCLEVLNFRRTKWNCQI